MASAVTGRHGNPASSAAEARNRQPRLPSRVAPRPNLPHVPGRAPWRKRNCRPQPSASHPRRTEMHHPRLTKRGPGRGAPGGAPGAAVAVAAATGPARRRPSQTPRRRMRRRRRARATTARPVSRHSSTPRRPALRNGVEQTRVSPMPGMLAAWGRHLSHRIRQTPPRRHRHRNDRNPFRFPPDRQPRQRRPCRAQTPRRTVRRHQQPGASGKPGSRIRKALHRSCRARNSATRCPTPRPSPWYATCRHLHHSRRQQPGATPNRPIRATARLPPIAWSSQRPIRSHRSRSRQQRSLPPTNPPLKSRPSAATPEL